MKITKVQATCHSIPVKLPLDKVIKEAAVVVRVETDEGITGTGITMGRMRFSTREYINRELAPFLVGKNPLDTEKIWNKDAYAELGLPPPLIAVSEMVRWGFSPIDIALWDIKGKYFNQPIFRLLGGSTNRIPVYVTFGLHIYSRTELAEAARYFVGIGQHNLKMQVSYTPGPDMAEEEARVRVVREAMGNEGMLMLDANDRFTLRQAKEMAKRVEPYNITWFEAPVTDYRQMPAVRQSTSIPIGHSGGLPGRRWLYRDLITMGAVDILQPNVITVGGFTEALKIAHLAQAFSMPIATGAGQPHHNMHLIAGVANGWIVEFHYAHMLRDEIIFVDAPRFDRGWITLPEKQGLGFEPNEAALKEYLET
ncbi:MAG: mandelate racemase/muconate lactonizing enzyme family protein [Chloroflexi bacterium]|nr:mandelate racemase/muconate lactonizing enzyme family protein [Chloroflexota bacterium]